MPIKWGIGIEHETMILDYHREYVSGIDIKDNLNTDLDHYVIHLINRFIKSGLYYQNEVTNTPRSLFQDTGEIYEELDNYYWNFLNDDIFIQLLETYVRYFTDHSEYYLEKNKETIIAEILKELCTALSIDSSNYTRLFEFKTSQYSNNTIASSVMKLDLQEKLFLRCLEIMKDKDLYLPTIGTIFPLYYQDEYVIDYSGSIHLNLSLPYDSLELDDEEDDYYYDNYNQVHKYSSRKYDSLLYDKWNKFNYLQKKEFILNDNFNNSPLNKPRYQKYHNMMKLYLQRVRNIVTWGENSITWGENSKPDPDVASRFLFDLSYNHESKNFSINIKYYLLDQEPYLLFTLKDFKYLKGDFGLVKTRGQVAVFFQKLGEMNHNIMTNYYLTFDSNFNLIRIPKKGVNVIMDYQELLQSKLLHKDKKIKIPVSKTEFINEFLIDLIKLPIIENYKNITRSILDIINSMINLENKYQLNTFHGKHKTWAILIQWILPLLLAVCSSCDPFSIGDHNKLTELSYRLFTAGYSFINMADIKNYQIPNERDIDNRQNPPSIISKMMDKYPYWSGMEKKRDIRGSEFRVDSRYGFDFGFELRVFDNLKITHLEEILEFLFLLADHMTDRGIDKKGVEIDPFNHPIIEIEIRKIISQGWNTYISKSYIKLLNQVLKLHLGFHQKYTAYDVINDIYHYFQNRYLENGKGKGSYSKYVIKRNRGRKSLYNVNRESWEHAFHELIEEPGDNIWNTIQRCLKQSVNPSGYRNPRLLINCIESELGSKLKYDIHDVLYYLESRGDLKEVKKYI